MQEVAMNIDGRFLFPIDLIPYNGAPQKFAVQPNLMCAPGQRVKFKQGVMWIAFDSLIFRNGFTPAAFGDNRHFFTMTGITADISFYAPGGCGRLAIYKCKISLFHFSQAELILQPTMSAFILCEQN